jgi:DNA polymerase I-like protein with 3'-5' exonuclease and polymerase domains
MPYVYTDELQQGIRHLYNDQLYNGLDACITLEVFEELCGLSNRPPPVYDFSRALQAPVLEMMLRGFAVDEYERQAGLRLLRERRTVLNNALQLMAYAVWDRPLNPRSPPALRAFFYDTMRLPVQHASTKGERRVSTNRECLEKLEVYLYARPIIATILAVRDTDKQIEDFEQLLDPDGRFRTSFNIAGTETWRFSSSKSPTGTGGNIQNKTRDDDPEFGKHGEQSLRKPFIADAGMKLCELDLEQAESRECGLIFGTLFDDWSYLDACEQDDLHTTTARMVWPGVITDRKSADRSFYRNYTYRDMSKRGGHLTSYMGTAWTMSRSLKIPLRTAEAFQLAFATGPKAAFPAFPRWWRHCAQQLQTKQELCNSFGVTRLFFGRPSDDATLREAVAFGPQSSTAMRTNLGLWRIWRTMHDAGVQVLAQKHDSVTFQYPEGADEAGIVKRARACMSTPLACAGRTYDVPTDAKVGWNWGAYGPRNPNGMRKFRGTDDRRRLVGMERPL